MTNFEIDQQFSLMKQNSWKLRESPISRRIEILKKLKKAVLRREGEIIAALWSDFQKPETESLVTEIYPVLNEINFILSNLQKWVRPETKAASLFSLSATSKVQFEPKGVVLVISPWNYPFCLALNPLISALAAGNCAILKPSELTPAVSRLLQSICEECFPNDLVKVYCGGKEVAEQLLELPFDHIFFTGSTQVGRIVMQAAAKNLAPVTLELGGKSPTIIDETADLKLAAQKIVWGKLVNNGQTCIAPDYLMIHQKVFSEFVAHFKNEIEKQNAQHSLMITERHADRLRVAIDQMQKAGAQILLGDGTTTGRQLNAVLMDATKLQNQALTLLQEEIFGPILPVFQFSDLDDVIHFIQKRPKPLALYLFSRHRKNQTRIMQETSSGAVCINELILHLANHNLPFGGIGESGTGHYHGHYGFKTFSHEKAILIQGIFGQALTFFFPPYTNFKKQILRFLVRLGR